MAIKLGKATGPEVPLVMEPGSVLEKKGDRVLESIANLLELVEPGEPLWSKEMAEQQKEEVSRLGLGFSALGISGTDCGLTLCRERSTSPQASTRRVWSASKRLLSSTQRTSCITPTQPPLESSSAPSHSSSFFFFPLSRASSADLFLSTIDTKLPFAIAPSPSITTRQT